MALVKFFKGDKSSVPYSPVQGQVYITYDMQDENDYESTSARFLMDAQMMVDVNDHQRAIIGARADEAGVAHNLNWWEDEGDNNYVLKEDAGSATQPIYFAEGKPVAGTYQLNKTVPADAVFTDTVYDPDDTGSVVQPVYFAGGVPVATTYQLNKTVPADAKFTDTTYGPATSTADGLMTAEDKAKLESMSGGFIYDEIGDLSILYQDPEFAAPGLTYSIVADLSSL